MTELIMRQRRAPIGRKAPRRVPSGPAGPLLLRHVGNGLVAGAARRQMLLVERSSQPFR